jgi:hypothetical protein
MWGGAIISVGAPPHKFGLAAVFLPPLVRRSLATILSAWVRATYTWLVIVCVAPKFIAMEVKMVDEKHKRPASPPIRIHPDTILAAPQPNEVTLEPEPDAAHLEEEETATGIVSGGHSIHVNTGQRIACGYDAVLSRTVFRSAFTVAGPGETVTLAKSEIEKLMAAGFLVDQNLIAEDTTTH